jgi:hypothetical protein
MSQNKTILAHLTTNGQIDAITAIRKYSILRVAARIKNLRDKGYNIKTEMVMKNKKNFAIYKLES